MKSHTPAVIWLMLAALLGLSPWRIHSRQLQRPHLQSGRLLVGMTLVPDAAAKGAVCLDGSLPAYHLDRGFGDGDHNWLLQFEGGGWCNDVASCLDRSRTRRGSTHYMNKEEVFSGILSNDPSQNPDFYNWNRVKLRYCDGASFGGDSMYSYNGVESPTAALYFRGQRIWNAIVDDLLSKGLSSAQKALLSGCSAGGLATFLHCDDFKQLLPQAATVKCLSDAGFFLNAADVSGNNTIWPFFNSLVTLQGVRQNLDKNCISSLQYPNLCFFPQYALPYIKTPYFILNAAYDVYQFNHILVPPSADPQGHWNHCKLNPTECTPDQISILQDFRLQMIAALGSFENSRNSGVFINSCFAHCQSELQDTWFAPNSLQINNKTIAKAVGDWFFEREVTWEVDCPYPCDNTCINLIPPTPGHN